MSEIKNVKDIINLIKQERKFLLILILVVLLAYVNVVRGELVTADDIPGIVQNPRTKDMVESLKTLNIYAIKNAVIYQIAEFNSHLHHAFSIFVHLLNIILVFTFIYIVFGKEVAVLGTIIFGFHPVNTEAVMWVSGSPYAINASFSLLILIFFSMYKKTDNKRYFIYSIVSYLLLTLNDKGAWPLVTPAIIGVLDQFIFSNKIKLKVAIVSMLPYILIAGTSAYLIMSTNYHNRLESLTNQYYFDPSEAPPLLNRAPFTIFSGAKYLVFPYELNIYPGEKLITLSHYKTMVFVTVVLLGLTIYFWVKNKRIYAGLILAILASLGPTFSPIQVAWLMTERYLYLGSVFFAIILALLFEKIKDRNVFKLTFGLLIVLYIVRIVLRSEDWRTNKNLWLSTLKFSPISYRVYNNLGDVYMKEGDYDKAIESFKKSFELFPGYADAMHNLGLVYLFQKDIVNAKKYMHLAVRTKPDLAPAWEKLGLIYLEDNQPEIARTYFLKALELNPESSISKQGLMVVEQGGGTVDMNN